MSFWDDLFSSSSTATSNTQSASQGSASSTKTTAQLDPATIAMLTSLLPGLIGGLTNNNALKDSNAIRTLAAQTGDVTSLNKNIDTGITASQASAEKSWETGAGATARTFASMSGGGKGNTFADLVTNNSSADLQAQLAQIMTQGKVQEGQLDTQARTSAGGLYAQAGNTQVSEQSAPMANLMSILSILKGANTTEDLSSLFSQTGTSSTQGSQTTNPSTMSDIAQLLGLFG